MNLCVHFLYLFLTASLKSDFQLGIKFEGSKIAPSPLTQFNHTEAAVACASHFLLGIAFALQGCKTKIKWEEGGEAQKPAAAQWQMKFIIHFGNKHLPCILLKEVVKTVTLLIEN